MQVKGSLQDLDFSSDGRLVAAAGLSGDIAIWDLARHRLARTIHHRGRPPVDSLLARRQDDRDRRLPRRRRLLGRRDRPQVGRTLGGQNGDVLSVTYSPSGAQVVTTSTDGQFRLWDLASGKLVGSPLPGADVGGWGTFFPDGKRVIAVFWSGIGMVWDVDPPHGPAGVPDRAPEPDPRGMARLRARASLPSRMRIVRREALDSLGGFDRLEHYPGDGVDVEAGQNVGHAQLLSSVASVPTLSSPGWMRLCVTAIRRWAYGPISASNFAAVRPPQAGQFEKRRRDLR